MTHKLRLLLARLRTTLWVRPLAFTAIALAGVTLAGFADRLPLADQVPAVRYDTLDDLLTVIATSMLSVATFAVASMVAAYASASSTATPRAFKLVVADDVSQTALSGFIGAFIFSLVGLTAVKSQFYGPQGLFVLYVELAITFAVVIMLFLRWVDNIARLGRLGSTIDRVERAAVKALRLRRERPTLGGVPATGAPTGTPVFGTAVGYVQAVDVGALQNAADRVDTTVAIASLPGAFVAPGRALAYVGPVHDEERRMAFERSVRSAFHVAGERTFEDDPRFGLIALSEIASRALSPAVNDPGTAIDIIGTFVRLFVQWAEPAEEPAVRFSRVSVPPLDMLDLFDDAFSAISRDGAGFVEVGVRLQKAFTSLAAAGDATMANAARQQARLARERAEAGLTLDDDRRRIRELADALMAQP